MAFATTEDVSTRLMRALSADETTAASYLLDAVSAEIVEEVQRSEADLDPAPDTLRFTTVEAVCRELASPVGAESTSETLGAYSYRVGYRETGGAFLTDAERLRVREAVFGTLTGSSTGRSLLDRIEDLRENRDVDEAA